MGTNQTRERRTVGSTGGVGGVVKNVVLRNSQPISDVLVRQEPAQPDYSGTHFHPPPAPTQQAHQPPQPPQQDVSPVQQVPTTEETAPAPVEPEAQVLPVIIRYKWPHQLAKGEKVPKRNIQLLLDSNQWKPIPMSPSDDNYYAVCYLPAGNHAFKFDVEGEVVLDASQPVTSHGEPANVVKVTEALLFSNQEDADLINSDEGWGQVRTEFDETRKHPPIMPPHLRYTPLNSPPTQIRCDVDGNMKAPTGAAPLDPEHMPLPLSVTINHAYFQRREDHTVLGMTTRYRNKFTTVAYYKKE